MKSKRQLAKDIDKFLSEFLADDERFEELSDNEKLYIYSLFNRILNIIYLQLKNPGVCPILFVHHPKTKQILDNVFYKISHYLPFVMDIKVTVMH